MGLVYNDKPNSYKLIGFITAVYIDVVINNVTKNIPYISLLCIHNKFRGYGLNKILINSLKGNLFLQNMTVPLIDKTVCVSETNNIFSQNNIQSEMMSEIKDPKIKKTNEVMFFSEAKLTEYDPSIRLKCYAIPINHKKLYEVKFLDNDTSELPNIPEVNPLHLLNGSDLLTVTNKLNNYMRKFPIKNFFTNNSAKHFLLPKKNIVYSFVNKNSDGIVTDFVSFYKNYYYCIKEKKMLSIGILSYYFYESMTLDDLITLLIGKMIGYDIDQLNFYNNLDNMTISFTKYLTDTDLKFYFIGDPVHKTPEKNVYLSDLNLNGNSMTIYPF